MVFSSLNHAYPKRENVLHLFITHEQNFIHLSFNFSNFYKICKYYLQNICKQQQTWRQHRVTFYYKEWLDKKRKPIELGKSSDSYKNRNATAFESEQKTIKSNILFLFFLIFCMKNLKEVKKLEKM